MGVGGGRPLGLTTARAGLGQPGRGILATGLGSGEAGSRKRRSFSGWLRDMNPRIPNHKDTNDEAGVPAAAAVRPTGGELATYLNVHIASPICLIDK